MSSVSSDKLTNTTVLSSYPKCLRIFLLLLNLHSMCHALTYIGTKIYISMLIMQVRKKSLLELLGALPYINPINQWARCHSLDYDLSYRATLNISWM